MNYKPMDSSSQSDRLAALRQQAEEALRSKPVSHEFSFNEVQEILHEIQVYQTELEIQNEELRQTQQQLQESRNRYIDLYDFAPAGYFTIDEHDLIVEVNLTGAALLRADRSTLTQSIFTTFVVKAERDTYYLFRKHLADSKQTHMCELRLHRSDGSSFYARLEGTIAEQDADEGVQYRCVVIDIDRQVAAEQALQAAHDTLEQRVQERTAELYERERSLRISEERFRMVLKDSPITVFAQDRDLCYTWIYNIPPVLAAQPMLGKTDEEIFSPDDAARLTALKRRVIDEGVAVHDDLSITVNGHIYWYDMKIEPLRDLDGRISGLMCAATDITDYRLAMDEQRLLAQLSTQLITSLNLASMLTKIAAIITDDIADGCVVHILSPDDSIEPPVIVHRDPQREETLRSWFQYLLDELQEQHLVLQVIQSEHAAMICESDGEQQPPGILHGACYEQYQDLGIVSLICTPLIARGRTIGAISIISDQSGRCYTSAHGKIMEELANRVAIAVDNAHLHHTAQQARTEAEAAVEARDHVFRIVSHDLRAPLSAIQGYTHLLQNRIQAADIPDAERFIRGLSNIKTSTHKMVAQIDELLDAASLQAGQPLSLSWDTFNLVTVTYNAVEACQDISTAHPIAVQTSEEQIIVGGDEMRMERVITNLLTNAIKYSPEGGEITVTLERQMQPENDKPGVALSVKDQGIGIPETDLPHIFNPFQRASNVSEQMKGSGLGLSSAYHIIQQQGGNITATSEEGVGSTFTIWLPTSQD